VTGPWHKTASIQRRKRPDVEVSSLRVLNKEQEIVYSRTKGMQSSIAAFGT